MPRKPPNPQAQKLKSLCMISSCLEVLKIPHRVESERIHIGEVVVKVESVPGLDSLRIGNTVSVSAAAICGGTDRAHAALWTVTELLNRGRPVVFNRGPPPTRRAYGDDHDRVVMRESAFRQSVNPPEEAFVRFGPWIDSCVRFFFMSNQDLCHSLAFGKEDLKTYALVWFSNFWTTARLLTPKDESENDKLLYRFLRQRFSQLYQQMKGPRRRNVAVDKETVRIGLSVKYRLTDDGAGNLSLQAVRDVEPELDAREERGLDEYRKRVCQLDVSTPDKRRSSAAALLSRSLAAMPHDAMVSALTHTYNSLLSCPDTRKEAGRQLEKHRKSCLACSSASVGPLPLDAPSVETVEVVVDTVDDFGTSENLCLVEGI